MTDLRDHTSAVVVPVFDGQHDRIELGRQPQFKIDQALTLEAWIYPQQRQSKWTGILSCIFDTGTKESGYGLLLDGKTGIRFGLTPSSSQRIVYLGSKANSLQLNQWQHIAATFDGEQMQVYINGSLKAQKTIAHSDIHYIPDNDLLIGMYRDDNQTYSFLGMMAEVRLWNVARSPDQLLTDRDRQLTGHEPGLVGYWPLSEGTGLTVHDKTHNGNHGTLRGSPRWTRSPLDLAPAPPAPPLIPVAVLDHSVPSPTIVLQEGSPTMAKAKSESTSTAPATTRVFSSQPVLSLGANHQGIAVGSSALKPQGRFTIEAWIYPNALSDLQVIFANGDALFYLEGGELKFRVNTTATPIASTKAGLKAGTWTHVAIARSGNRPGDTKLYINGIQNDNGIAVPAIETLSTTHLAGNPATSDSWFQGKLLEVRVWRYGRSEAEIQSNMTYFLTGRELGLIRCWAVDDGFGSAIVGKTTNRAVGTVIGDATWEEAEIPIKINLNAQERLTRSTGLEDYGFWFKEMAKQQKPTTDEPFRRGRIWA
jgi:cyanobactin cluster PatC/TenC/TruC protein